MLELGTKQLGYSEGANGRLLAKLKDMPPEQQWQKLLRVRDNLHRKAAEAEANAYRGPEALKELQARARTHAAPVPP